MDGFWKKLLILLSCVYTASVTVSPDHNPHIPRTLTWQVLDTKLGSILTSAQTVAPVGTWWPELGFCLRNSIHRASTKPPNLVRSVGFYACPGDTNYEDCGRANEFFCRSWACVTSNDGDWRWSVAPTDRIIFSFANSGIGKHVTMPLYNKPCSPRDQDYIKIRFTKKGKQTPLATWLKGMTWGLVLYDYGNRPGSLILIRLKIESLSPAPVGLDKVVTFPPDPPASADPPTPFSHSELTNGQRLFNLVEGAFHALNDTNPATTESCWLCLTVAPPYYEGIALNGTLYNTTAHHACSWGTEKKLTLTEVTGSGLCLGTPPSSHKHLCDRTVLGFRTATTHYLVPESNRWWACNTGLTPCVSTNVFRPEIDFCVLIQLVPKIYYHPAEDFEGEFGFSPGRVKREPVSLSLAILLGMGVAAGVGTGTAALVTGQQGLDALNIAINEDLKILEQSVTNLEKSLTSLSEVVLQNRRGLDLLFLKEGGLCAALKEECCFYADHTGVVRDSMQKLRERLDKRQRDRDAQKGWLESWFTRSPWISTLFSALMGPILIIALVLIFGPCVANKLIAFVKQRVDAVQLMVLRQQYRTVRTTADIERETCH